VAESSSHAFFLRRMPCGFCLVPNILTISCYRVLSSSQVPGVVNVHADTADM
jgi:hypothetical protein